MTMITLLAQLQESIGVPPLGLAELKAVGVLEDLLGGEKISPMLPFAVAAFLLEEKGLAKAVRSRIVAAEDSWITAARKPGNMTAWWTPSRQPQVPPTVVRALEFAETTRRFWTALYDGSTNLQAILEYIRALADEWRANEPSTQSRLDVVLSAITAAAAPEHGPARAGPNWLVSVSIDVAGSTEAKTRLQELNATSSRQHEFLRQFYQLFLEKELSFYDHLTTADFDRLTPLALEQIFYVKGIGDEVWLLIEPKGFDREHLLHLLARLLNAAQAVLSNPIDLRATAFEEGPEFNQKSSERMAESGYELLDLPFKVFIDKVDGAYPIAEQRAAAFKLWLNRLVEEGRVAYQDLAEVANRIGAGTGALAASTWRNTIRTDYIGHEIDRLFRAAKAARPMLITVGQNLWSFADPEAHQIPDGICVDRHFSVRCDPRMSNASYGFTYRARPETIPAADMKGIGADYRVFHVFDPASLRSQFARAATVRKNAESDAADVQTAPSLPQFVSDMEKLEEFIGDPSLRPIGIDAPCR